MYLSKTPHMARLLYPDLIWRVKDDAKNIYLTFDDGPDQEVTPDALELLDKYRAKATFFCVGEKVSQNPDLYQAVLAKGHKTGNHTYSHMNGRRNGTENYINNVEMAAELIHSRLFRPPYGRITPRQIRSLKGQYKIVMWSVLPGDFDASRSAENVLNRSVRHTNNGSIVVFHDNAKFKEKMLFALEGFLRHFSERGFTFKSLNEELI